MISKKRIKGEYLGTPVSTITNPEENPVPNQPFQNPLSRNDTPALEPALFSVSSDHVCSHSRFLLRQGIARPIQLLICGIVVLPEFPECLFAGPPIDCQIRSRHISIPQQFSTEILRRLPKQLRPVPLRTVRRLERSYLLLGNFELPHHN